MRWAKARLTAASAAAMMASAGLAGAQTQPQPAPETPAIAPPRDVPYPGVVRLAVDATDLAHAIFSVRESVPVQGQGPITLLYPRWLPGNHSPSGPIDKLAGLVVTAGGRTVA